MANREFSPELKLQIAREVEDGHKRMSQICRERSLSDSLVRRWFEQYRERGPDAFLRADPWSDEFVAAQTRTGFWPVGDVSDKEVYTYGVWKADDLRVGVW